MLSALGYQRSPAPFAPIQQQRPLLVHHVAGILGSPLARSGTSRLKENSEVSSGQTRQRIWRFWQSDVEFFLASRRVS